MTTPSRSSSFAQRSRSTSRSREGSAARAPGLCPAPTTTREACPVGDSRPRRARRVPISRSSDARAPPFGQSDVRPPRRSAGRPESVGPPGWPHPGPAVFVPPGKAGEIGPSSPPSWRVPCGGEGCRIVLPGSAPSHPRPSTPSFDRSRAPPRRSSSSASMSRGAGPSCAGILGVVAPPQLPTFLVSARRSSRAASRFSAAATLFRPSSGSSSALTRRRSMAWIGRT
jgi:hypothetical protein